MLDKIRHRRFLANRSRSYSAMSPSSSSACRGGYVVVIDTLNLKQSQSDGRKLGWP